MGEKNVPIEEQKDDYEFHVAQLKKARISKSSEIRKISDLSEFISVAQNELDKGIKRRWFQNEIYMFIVWYDLKTDKIVGFQICYGKNGSDKAITWYNEKESSHRYINYHCCPVNGAG